MSTTLSDINSLNKVDKNEIDHISHVLYYCMRFENSDIKNNNIAIKPKLIAQLKKILEDILSTDYLSAKEEKVRIIKLIDKLNQQEAAVELAIGNRQNLKVAAERLGRKSQSAFNSPKSRKKVS